VTARPGLTEPITIVDIAMSEAQQASAEVLDLALEWRRMQRFAGHNELNAKLAALGQAVDRYERTR
jgi:hypothetical protein